MKIYNKKKVCFRHGGLSDFKRLAFLSAVRARRAETGTAYPSYFGPACNRRRGNCQAFRSQMARKDKLDELDERNQLIAWKTQEQSFSAYAKVSPFFSCSCCW